MLEILRPYFENDTGEIDMENMGPYFFPNDEDGYLIEDVMRHHEYGVEIGFGLYPAVYHRLPHAPTTWIAYEPKESHVGMSKILIQPKYYVDVPSGHAYFLLARPANREIVLGAKLILYVNPVYDTVISDGVYLPPRKILRPGQRVVVVVDHNNQDEEMARGLYSNRLLRPSGYETSMFHYYDQERCPWTHNSHAEAGYYLFDYTHQG